MINLIAFALISFGISHLVSFAETGYSQAEIFIISFGIFSFLNWVLPNEEKHTHTTIENTHQNTLNNNGVINVYMGDRCQKVKNTSAGGHEYIDMLGDDSVLEYMEMAKRDNHDLAYSIHLLKDNGDISDDEAKQLQAMYLDTPKSVFRSTSEPLLEEYKEVTHKLTKKLEQNKDELQKHKDALESIRKAWLSSKQSETVIDTQEITPLRLS